jgi:hypothetical protein
MNGTLMGVRLESMEVKSGENDSFEVRIDKFALQIYGILKVRGEKRFEVSIVNTELILDILEIFDHFEVRTVRTYYGYG